MSYASPSADPLEATDKHRSLGQVEWSRQLSRDVFPYFIPRGTTESRAQFTSGCDVPRRHTPCLDMERAPAKHLERAPDTRDYTPKLYNELHPHCAVDLRKSAGRVPIFGIRKYDAETVVEVEKHPGWGRGKGYSFPRAPRSPSPKPQLDNDGSRPPHFLLSAYTPLPEPASFGQAIESHRERAKGGFIPIANHRAVAAAPSHDALNINEDSVRRNVPTVKLVGSSRVPREKASERYRKLFRTPPPAPLASPDRPNRRIPGYAPLRQSTDRTVEALLALADADHKRAKTLQRHNFGAASRSPTCMSVLYSTTTTPQPLQASS